uniref:DNA translocase FtsK n=1 Tax=Oscillibacter sp. TaxID=1945593 RepID=UPI002D7E9D30
TIFPSVPVPAEPAPAPEPEKAPLPTAETFTRSGKAETAKEVAAQTAAVAAEIEEKLAAEDGAYQYPPVDLLKMSAGENHVEAGAELRNNSRRLAETLTSFGVDAAPGDVIHGPAVTRYEFILEQGVKLSKITNLADDIALALGATGVRIAPIPDKISVVGIEVPNKQVTPVLIRDVIESREFAGHKSNVAFALGRDIGGRNVIGDIGTLPHVLIAGTTGSGKSVCTNSLIISLLYKSTPEDVRFIMVDPKMVELAPYNGIPHLLIPVVTDPKKAAGALQWAVFEMMKRYKTFSEHGVKKLEEFNQLAKTKEDLEPLPSVVVVIDELADLMLVAAKEVEESICRVAQMGRAAGMHLVIATQRPSADVITGLMKANIPSRIAFAVASSMESRIILDNGGAEKLVGRGDMLYAPLGAGKPTRVQGCFITPEEIDRVVSFVKQTGETQYDDDVIAKIEESVQEKGKAGKPSPEPQESEEDELLPAAVEVILETGQASTSMLQRRLKLGYSRAARLVDQLEERGYVGPFEGSKPRQLLITKEKWQEMKMGGGDTPEPPPEDFGDE